MEVKKGGQALIGYPALIDKGSHVEIEVFDEPEAAAEKHRVGLRRLFALQLRDALKYLEKNLPDLQRMAIAVPAARQRRGAARADHRRRPRPRLPRRAAADRCRGLRAAAGGRARAADADRRRGGARSPASVLAEWVAAQKKLKDARPPKDVADDVAAAARAAGAEALPRRDAVGRGWPHLPRYLKAIVAAARQAAAPIRRATRRAWPSCGRSSSATCASSPSGAAAAIRSSTSSAGGSRSCGSACSPRS